jgi:hypothetical protein
LSYISDSIRQSSGLRWTKTCLPYCTSRMQHSIESTSNYISSLTKHQRNEWTIRNSYSATIKVQEWASKSLWGSWWETSSRKTTSHSEDEEVSSQVCSRVSVSCGSNRLRWWHFNIAILLRTQQSYQRWDNQNELTWRASEYDQYLHQHQQSSMRMTDEVYRALHIKNVKRCYTLRRGDPINLDAIKKHCEQQSWVKQEQCMSKLYKPQPWWAETCECYNCEKLKHLARTCKKSQWERKLQQWIHV